MTRGFLSDNASGIHPRALAALAEANEGHAPSYGTDRWTAALQELVRDIFGPDAGIFPVFNGTGGNVISVQALLQRWDAVVATTESHMVNDESTAPQLVGGTRIVTVGHTDGKATPESLAPAFDAYDGTVRHARPAAVTIAQATELGTTYTLTELTELTAYARHRDARVHVDGARLANAAVRLRTGLREAVGDVHLLTFGGTKNGLLLGDAVVTLDPALAEAVDRLRKASTQLASKMRFVSAQLLALLSDGLWQDNARRANAAADLLADKLATLGLSPRYPVGANAVFIPVPAEALTHVLAEAPVLRWDATTVRAVASYDTTEDDVDALVATLARHLDC
ncbi:threonine aldolase family protein [Georgenia halophila]